MEKKKSNSVFTLIFLMVGVLIYYFIVNYTMHLKVEVHQLLPLGTASSLDTTNMGISTIYNANRELLWSTIFLFPNRLETS